jgi:hypothetical protein
MYYPMLISSTEPEACVLVDESIRASDPCLEVR